MKDAVIEWLLAGDPAIRWRVMRDLLDALDAEWQAERWRTLESGWGAQLLALQDAAGTWGGGIYTPKWTSTFCFNPHIWFNFSLYFAANSNSDSDY